MFKSTDKIKLEAKRLENWDNIFDVDELLSVIKPGKILEVGCGTGKIINSLSQKLPDSFFVGIDIEEYMINLAVKKKIKNAVFIKACSTHNLFSDKEFDSVIFRDSIHEISEKLGRKGVMKSLKNAYRFLKPRGRIIIRDGLVPPKNNIRIFFKSERVRNIFNIFIKKFDRKIKFREDEQGIIIGVRDLINFLTKIKKIEIYSKIKELKETKHYSLKQYVSLLESFGFKEIGIKKYKFPKKLIPEDISFEQNKLPYSYCMLVYQK